MHEPVWLKWFHGNPSFGVFREHTAFLDPIALNAEKPAVIEH